MPSTSPELSFKMLDEVVRAGAGAGKTTALTARVIDGARSFYREHGRYPRVIVTTFTRKATQELRERLMVKASEAADPGLLDFVSSKSQLLIATIHGVLSQFINKYGYLASIDPNYQVVSGAASLVSAKKVLREVIFAEPERQEILERIDFERLCRMLLDYSEYRCLYPQMKSHDRESFSEIYERRLKNLSLEFHKTSRLVLEESESEDWKIYSEALEGVSQALLRGEVIGRKHEAERAFSSLKKPRKSKKNPPVSDELSEHLKALTQEGKRLFSDKKEDRFYNVELWPEFFEEFELFEKIAADFFVQFSAFKMRSGQVEMSDLEALSLQLIKDFPEAARQFSAEKDYWLIDEYQDTSPVQVRLLEKLVGEKPHFVVGDPQQSIYIFRGAQSKLFFAKEKQLEASGGEVGFLKKNYRSAPPLLEFFNDFFAAVGSQFSRMEPRVPVEKGEEQKLVATFALCSKDDNEEEYSDEFKALTTHLEKLIKGGARLEEICILGRTNRRLEETALLLSQLGYPVHLHSASGFYSRREILDSMAILKFLSNPHDDQNLVLLLRSPWFHLGDSKLVEFCQQRISEGEKKKSLWHVLSCHPESIENNPALSYLREIMSCASTWGYSLTLQKALDECGLFDWSRSIDSTGRRESNLWKLIHRLAEDERRAGFNINEFVEGPKQEQAIDEGNEETDAIAALEPNRINMMTVHSSKGLQFDHVILTDLHRKGRQALAKNFSVNESHRWAIPLFFEEDQSLTSSIAAVEDAENQRKRELEEQERLFYVALTRAKQTVYMSWQKDVQKNSLASLIRWDLEKGDHQREKYRYSVEDGGFELHSYLGTESERKKVRPRLSLPENSPQNLKPVSVSELLEEASRFGASAKENASMDEVIPSLLKSREGVQIHRLFELLRYLPAHRREKMIGEWKNEKAAVAEAIEFTFSLATPPVGQLLQKGHVEWGFVCRFQETLLEGQIDLWGCVDDTIWVIDYKTGNPRYKERAFRQLALYGHGIRMSGRKEKMKYAVIYPMDQQVFVREEEEGLKILQEIESFKKTQA